MESDSLSSDIRTGETCNPFGVWFQIWQAGSNQQVKTLAWFYPMYVQLLKKNYSSNEVDKLHLMVHN